MSLFVTSERTSVFRVKYSDLLGYPKVSGTAEKIRMNIPSSRGKPYSLGERS